jgi:hypothetical protein
MDGLSVRTAKKKKKLIPEIAPIHGMNAHGGVDQHSFLTSALDGGG